MSSLDSVKIIRPDIVSHCDPGKKSRLAIYSIDFQNGGWRVASSGGGEDSDEINTGINRI
jgi:hypothetical protein